MTSGKKLFFHILKVSDQCCLCHHKMSWSVFSMRKQYMMQKCKMHMKQTVTQHHGGSLIGLKNNRLLNGVGRGVRCCEVAAFFRQADSINSAAMERSMQLSL